MEFKELISKKLKEMRKIANVTQNDMALLLGVKQPTISEYECGKNIGIEILQRYSEALKLKITITIEKE